jgi:hypothetical protein
MYPERESVSVSADLKGWAFKCPDKNSARNERRSIRQSKKDIS